MFGLRSNRFQVEVDLLRLEQTLMQPNEPRNSLNKKNGIIHTEDDVPVYTIYLGSIPARMTDQRLKNYFSRYGVVESLHIIKKKVTDNNERIYRYGFLRFQTAEAATAVLSQKHGGFCKSLKIKPADTWKQPKKAIDSNKTTTGESSSSVEETKEIVNDTTDAEGNLTVMALNDDCLRHILSYLTDGEIYRLSFVCRRFYNLVESLIQANKLFDFYSIINERNNNFTLMETRRLLSNFGHNIRRLRLSCWGDYKRYLEFIAIYCPNLESIDFQGLQDIHPGTYKRTFQSASTEHLKSLVMEDCNLSDNICRLMSVHHQLKTLNLSGNTSISGKFLNKFTALEDLNLGKCEGLKSQHFVDMCRKMKWKSLNIVGCYQLDDHVFNCLARTQADLVNLVIGTSYQAMRMEELANLKSLKNIRIYGELNAMRSSVDCLIRELADKRNETMETLELYFLTFLSDQANREALLKFRNLKRLALVRDKYLNNAYLMAITKACPNLEEVILSDSTGIEEVAIVDLVQNLKHLKLLDLTDHCGVTGTIIQQIYSILEKRRNERGSVQKLTINIANTGISEDEHKNTRDLIKLSRDIDLSYENFDEMSEESYSDLFDHFHDFVDDDSSDESWHDHFDDYDYYDDPDYLGEDEFINALLFLN